MAQLMGVAPISCNLCPFVGARMSSVEVGAAQNPPILGLLPDDWKVEF